MILYDSVGGRRFCCFVERVFRSCVAPRRPDESHVFVVLFGSFTFIFLFIFIHCIIFHDVNELSGSGR